MIKIPFPFFIFLLLLTASCEDRLNVSVEGGAPRLVVDGFVSDLDEPTEVKLSWTTGYDHAYAPPRVSGAGVCLVDSEGNCTELKETKEGVYSSPGTEFRGQAGRSYHLEISLPDGREYVSEPELLRPAPGIDSAYFSYVEKEELNSDNYVIKVPGIQLYADMNNSMEEANFTRLTWEGTYEYIGPLDPQNRKCWVRVEEAYNRFRLVSDENFDGPLIRKLEAGFIEADFRFLLKYGIELRQFALSPGAFHYFTQLEDQLDRGGSLTDPPPYRVVGNIRNVADSNEVVLGYFYAAGADLEYLFVERLHIATSLEQKDCDGPPFAPPPPDCLDCMAAPNSSEQPPLFWQ